MTISAEVIAHSLWEGQGIITMKLRYPRFIHAEFMTHRMFSRNASSSRAIPVERLIEDVLKDPAMPVFWGKNEPGMQAREECNAEVVVGFGSDDYVFGSREEGWLEARRRAVGMARMFSSAGYHKQIVNRLLEPFSHINVIVTATEWKNFFALRCHPDAQPEIRELAEAMRSAVGHSVPKETEWHIPFDPGDMLDFRNRLKWSVASCARVSYKTHEGIYPTLDMQVGLYERLSNADPMHASPFEHQAKAVPSDWFANFKGWKSLRWQIENEEMEV